MMMISDLEDDPLIQIPGQGLSLSSKYHNGCHKDSWHTYKEIIQNDKVAKVSIVGAGMVSTPGVTYRMFRALSDEDINILAISTSEIKLSVIIEEDNTLKAIKKLHTIFDLD